MTFRLSVLDVPALKCYLDADFWRGRSSYGGDPKTADVDTEFWKRTMRLRSDPTTAELWVYRILEKNFILQLQMLLQLCFVPG